MSRAQILLRKQLKETQNEIYRLSILLGQLANSCVKIGGHVIVPRDLEIMEKLKTDKWASTSAICLVCGTDFGWWCPESPDHICHYSRSEDECDYCHMPMERK